MGLFILPGRLKTELALLRPYLTGAAALTPPPADDPRAKHFDWVCQLAAAHGLCVDDAAAEALLRTAVGQVCAQVLKDCGVYKQTPEGLAGVLRFLNSVGYTAE